MIDANQALKAIDAPLPCFALEHDARSEKCQKCPHESKCLAAMGIRANKVRIADLEYNFLPSTLPRVYESFEEGNRDLSEIYQTAYQQVFATNPSHSLGLVSDRVISLAKQAKVSVAMYVLTNMVGFQLTWPELEFHPGNLVDNRALHRVKVYAQACLKKFATLDVTALDNLTGGDAAFYSLEERMLKSEKIAGDWIIHWKLENEGPPYDAMFKSVLAQLDPNWLAIEARYLQLLLTGTVRPSSNDQHLVADTVRRLKKRKHEARGNFLARERAMPRAVAEVLQVFGYEPVDFEAPNVPVTDPLRFWHRLALAVQHMECLKLIDDSPSYYAD